MTASKERLHHIAAVLPPAWGHTVGYLHLAVQMLAVDPTLVVTIVQHISVVPQVEKELSTAVYDKTRLKILGVGSSDYPAVVGPADLAGMMSEIGASWLQLVEEYFASERKSEWPRPHALHFDMIPGGATIDATKALLGANSQCKLVMWGPGPAYTMKTLVSELDYASLAAEIHADEAKRRGRSEEQIQIDILAAQNGTDVISSSVMFGDELGLPRMYDYEQNAYGAGSGSAGVQWGVMVCAQKLAREVDAIVVTSSPALEPVGLPYLKEWYRQGNGLGRGGKGQEMFALGLQTHEAYFADGATLKIMDEKVRAFLDSALGEHGSNSVLYISFGSFFFPIVQLPHVEALINTLLSMSFPFVFALGGALARNALPQDLIERVNAGGKGLICQSWVEQRAILQHEAVGWFLTHGGFNSITEALVEGIPLMVWPVGAEQPLNANYFSAEPTPIAFEFLQIRTDKQIGPSLRHPDVEITGAAEDAAKEFTAVFEAARGDKGKRLRSNVRNLSVKMREARRGSALEEVKRLAKY
ncbi:hypothetical protein MKEN_00987600 [Mycena kentingensis (nom. inval.)]|nr:hypothetical protein MKEN_00987600 [Mycena kentingensis (nom. inval.)]